MFHAWIILHFTSFGGEAVLKFFFLRDILTVKSRYEVGLGKLDSAAEQVGLMQNELVALQPKLLDASAQVQVMMAKVQSESADVAKVEQTYE